VKFTLSSSSHSASQSSSNCSLQRCNMTLINDNRCRSSPTPCFDYHTSTNYSYCAPGILCSILEPCNNTTYTCASITSVCVINSCCSPRAMCLPLSWTTFCAAGNTTFQLTDEYLYMIILPNYERFCALKINSLLSYRVIEIFPTIVTQFSD
jgi:hypothetical protein